MFYKLCFVYEQIVELKKKKEKKLFLLPYHHVTN